MNRSFANRATATRGATANRTAALSQNRASLNHAALNRNNTPRLNRANLAATTNPALAGRRTAMANTPNANRFRANTRTGVAPNLGNVGAARPLVNAGDPRRSFASNQFAYRSGNFQPGWNPGRSYYWHGYHWHCYNGIWAVAGIGWPYDWEAYPYPFWYNGCVYYDGDVCQPGGIPVSSTMVADIQATLDNDGYNAGAADGIDGPMTQQAIAAYQADNGMQPTGVIDQPLLQSLGLA